MKHKNAPNVAAMLLSAGLSLGYGQTPPAGQAKLKFLAGPTVRIPVKSSDNLLFLQIKVNGSEPVWFAFDTGAGQTAIDTALAERLKLDLSDRVSAGGREVIRAHGLSLAAPGLELTGQSAMVAPLGDIALFSGEPLAGILGYELLRQAAVEIDFAGRALVIHDPADFKYAGTGQSLPLDVVRNWPIVNARLEQEGLPPIENKILLDSGSMSVISLMTGKLARRTIDFPVSAGIAGVGAGKARLGRITALTIGPWTFRDPIAAFPPAESKEEPDDLAKAVGSTGIGLVGSPLLRRFKLIFNYPEKFVVLEGGPEAGAPFEFDASGLILMSANPKFESFKVLAMIEGSPAAEAGLKPGDIILSVDGKSASGITLGEVRETFRRQGARHTLGVRRGDEALTVSLVTRRLI